MKIAIIDGSLNPPTFVKALISGLHDAGVEVALVGKSSGSENIKSQCKKIFTEYKHFNTVRLLFDFLTYAALSPANFNEARKMAGRPGSLKLKAKSIILYLKLLHFNPHLIHFQWVNHLLNHRQMLQRGRFKIMVSLRGKQINIDPFIDHALMEKYREVFMRVTAFHAVSEAIRKKTLEMGDREQSIRVIYSPVPSFFFEHFSAATRISRDPFRIISVGRFHWKKGYRYAVDAVKFLRNHTDRKIEYVIVAQGEIPDELRYQVKDQDLTTTVRIINGLSQSKIVDELLGASIFLLPSVEEGIANVALEAMAVGLPVLSTDCGGMGEVVIQGKTGFIVPRRNSLAMGQALADYLQLTDEAIDQLRINAWKKVKEEFHQPEQIRKFIHYYQSLI